MESGNYEDVPETNVMNYSPVGTILPWVPKPEKNDSASGLSVPEGWVRCDGSIIPTPSIWAGQRTPDLNNEMRFLRGSSDDTVLNFEEDMILDHEHLVNDPGHTHEYGDNWRDLENGYWNSNSGSQNPWRNNKPHDRITQSEKTGLSVKGVSNNKSRTGNETRPRNMHVIYIMRVY